MQGSMNVLNPVRRLRATFVDFARSAYRRQRSSNSSRTVVGHLARVKLDPSVLAAYPHELSGGMRQRATIALATICRPDFIIADEPTTALDVVVQKDVLGMIRGIQREIGSSVLFVTHDMGVHAHLTDRLGIMYAGRLVEEAATRGDLPQSAASLHQASDLEPAAHRRRRAAQGTGRRAAQSRRSAAGMPLSSALSAGDGGLQPRACPTWSRPSRRTASPASPSTEARSHEHRAARCFAMSARSSPGAGCSRAGAIVAVNDVSFQIDAATARDLHRSSANPAAARPRCRG